MRDDKFLRFGAAVVVVFLLGVFLKLAKPVLIPFCLALFLSLALTPVLDALVRRKVPKSVALVVILCLTFILLYLMGVLFYSSGKQFAAELPSYNEMMKSFLDGLDQTIQNPRLKAEALGWINSLNAEKVGGLILSALGPFLSFMSQLLLVFVFMIFILAGRGRMETKIARAFPLDQAAAVTQAMRRIDRQVQKYLAVKTLMCVATGLLTAVILALFRVPFAVVFGVLAFLLNYIPTLGSIIATALPVLLAAFYFGSLGQALAILVLLMVLNLSLGNVVEPRLMGKGLGLSPLLVFFSLFFGSWLWGIPGMILSVPILAILKIIFGNIPSLKILETMMD
ncbi:MAG: AI-2E family transporter [Acidobacteriota bacterium]